MTGERIANETNNKAGAGKTPLNCFTDVAETICPTDSIAENKKDHHAVLEYRKSGIVLLFLQPENLWNGAAKSGDAVTTAAGNAESLEHPK